MKHTALRQKSRDKRMVTADFSGRRIFNNLILALQRVRIVSHPKSGRTWMRLMLHDLNFDPKFTHADSAGKKHHDPASICENMPNYFNKRVIFLIRDPRDTIVSYYFHAVQEARWDGDLKEFIRTPEVGFERILAFNKGWLSERERFSDFMVASYEQMHEDTESVLKHVVDFCRIPFVGEDSIKTVAERNRFQKLKSREKSGELREAFGDRFAARGADDDVMQIRRGRVAGYTDYLDDGDVEFCNELMARYDYTV